MCIALLKGKNPVFNIYVFVDVSYGFTIYSGSSEKFKVWIITLILNVNNTYQAQLHIRFSTESLDTDPMY